MQGRLRSGLFRLMIPLLAGCAAGLGQGVALAAAPATPPGRAGAPSTPPPQVPTIPPDLIQPSGPRPASPGETSEPLKLGPKPSEAVDAAQRERCGRASYIVRQANELGDDSPLTVSYIRQALNLCPNHPAANVRMGILLFRQKNAEGARKAFEQALRDGSRIPEVHYNLGILARKEKKDAEAIERFRRAAELDPRHAQALYNLGVMQARAQDRGRAIESFRGVIQANPKMAEAHFFLGALLQEQGQRPEAKAALEEAVKLNPRLALPHIYLAAILEAEGKSGAAQEELNRAVRLNPASVQVGYSLEDFYAKEGRANDFVAQLQEPAKEEAASIPPPEAPAPGPGREAKEVPAPRVKEPERPARPKSAAPAPKREPAPRREARLPAPQRREPAGRPYRVRPGDTLASIAARHGTSVAMLARLNRDRIEHPSLIEPGQEILLPPGAKPAGARTAPAKRAPSKPAPAKAAPAKPAPRAPAPAAEAKPPAPPRDPYSVHRVQPGETLARIARQYRTSVENLMRLNRDRIEHPSAIQAGQLLRVPAQTSRAPTPRVATK